MNLPFVGNLNSTHGHVMIALIILLVFGYVDDGHFVEKPLDTYGGTGFVLAVLGVVYLTALANRGSA